MIFGAHVVVYSHDEAADRAFFRDVLGFASVDAGHGWLIFALPPAELGIHPAEDETYHELYLMCDDVAATIRDLKGKGVECAPVQETGFGLVTRITIPGGGKIGLYQPKHPIAIGR